MKIIFEDGIKKLGGIDIIERKIKSLENFFKSEPITFLKAPTLPNEKPVEPNYDEMKKGVLDDENLWVWNLCNRLRNVMNKAIIEPKN